MKGFIQRLALLIHWIGFLCLVVFIFLYGFGLSFTGADASEGLEILFEILLFEDGIFSAMVWLGIAHWPIKWLINGNKALFPWQS